MKFNFCSKLECVSLHMLVVLNYANAHIRRELP